jgi:N-hydroxyarylamine O-acetyltransferase
MPPVSIDLPRYLARIGWTGEPPRPALNDLRALAALHTAAIPFENINPLLGVRVSLDVADLERKMVTGGRGGYCFEQNRLFATALQAIGFELTTLIARVLWTKDEDAITTRSHMLLKVETESGPHLVDVGFGGLTLTGALALQEEVEQATPHEPFRLTRREDGDWRMQAKVQGEWKTLYRFDLQPQHPIDYEAPNHYAATFPLSHFTDTLIVARTLPGVRLALRNGDYTTHRLGQESEKRRLGNADEICRTLVEDFGLRLPEGDALQRRLAEVTAAAETGISSG